MRGRISTATKNMIKTAYSQGATPEELAKETNRSVTSVKQILGLIEGPKPTVSNQKVLRFNLSNGQPWSIAVPLNLTDEDVTIIVDSVSNYYEELNPVETVTSVAEKFQKAIAEDEALALASETEAPESSEDEDVLVEKYYQMQASKSAPALEDEISEYF